MKIYRTFVCLLFFCPLVSLSQQTSLNTEQRGIANVYVKFLSYQAFTKVCSAIANSQNFDQLLAKWQQANQQNIAQGQKILQTHYAANNLDFKNTFDGKTQKEMNYFNSLAMEGQKEHCHKLAYYLQSH